LPEGAKSLTFSISVNGDYPQLSRFLSELENLRRPIKIDNSGLSSAQTEEGSELVLLVSGRAPYLGQ
jgi:Tfp pilus assembly protein PilO